MPLRIAFATDDGINFNAKHFGDADFFKIYKIDQNNFELISTLENNSEEEKVHADPKKAKQIRETLLKNKVNGIASKKYGANIKRINEKFVCLVLSEANIENAIKAIQSNYRLIEKEFQKGKDRKHIKI